MSTDKSVRAQVLLTPDELEALRKVADRQARSVSYVAREFILAGLKKEGRRAA
jgi:hypothetical protein